MKIPGVRADVAGAFGAVAATGTAVLTPVSAITVIWDRDGRVHYPAVTAESARRWTATDTDTNTNTMNDTPPISIRRRRQSRQHSTARIARLELVEGNRS
ncbi:hypothetical protein C481_19605 [Natrialba asiatica DSM 12278]|uniref:Uncharacterized protein n=1 Tax=Natrialba asiatica (strain ATCC 700177 / DSM 12278 / JCM 9576 / FERM P-10747 / NBRC 102637 / 172P1) TaxID=29540 RepID=M0ALB9_NATA1|nr:hypothetical protein C481_19605 [Natrialba asiatica DSM 12278]